MHSPCLVFPSCRQKVGFNPLLPWLCLLCALQREPVQALLANGSVLGDLLGVEAPCVVFRGECWRVEGSVRAGAVSKEPRRVCRQRSCSQKSRQGACASLPALCLHGAREVMGAHGQCSREKFHLWSALRAWIKSWNSVGKMQTSSLLPASSCSAKPWCAH